MQEIVFGLVLHIRISVVAIATLLLASSARADTLGSRKNQRGVITRLDKGVFQLGIEGTLNLNRVSEGDATSWRTGAAGTLVIRFFPKANLGVSVRGSGVYRKSPGYRDLGFLGMLWGNYYLRLGEGVFLAPGVGAGLMVGQRDLETEASPTVVRANLTTGAAGIELPLAVFLSRRFALTAGPEFLLAFGNTKVEGSDDSTSHFSIDGTIKAGVVYSF